MGSFTPVGVILTAVVLNLVYGAVPVPTFLACVLDAAAAPVFTEVATGTMISNATLPLECTEACLRGGYTGAGINNEVLCFCVLDVADAAALPAGTCDLVCDIYDCGSSIDPGVFAVFDTGGGSPNFTLTAVTDNAALIDLTMVPDSTGTTFLIDFNYGAPLSYFNTTAVSTDVHLVPGTYEVTVIGRIEGTKLMSFESANLTKTDGVATSVDVVECPIVFEPDLVYYCNVSVTKADDSSTFVGTFDDTSEAFDITLGADFYRLGNPPPRGLTSDVLAPAGPASVILLKDHQITIEAEVIAFDLYGYAAGAYEVSMKRPVCASGVYCIDVKGCMEVCPFDVLANTHTCPAPQWFEIGPRTCSDLSAATAPASWDDVPGSLVANAFAGEGYVRELLAAPAVVLPGDVLHVTGPVGRMITDRSGGDEVDGVVTSDHYFLSAIIKEGSPIQLGHICTAISIDVNLNVADAADAAIFLLNHTSCERNITDMVMIVNEALTDAFDPTLNVEDPYYVRTTRPIIYTAIFSVAGPTLFTYTYVPDHGSNHTFDDPTDYPLVDVPYEIPHDVTIPSEGVYTVTINAENQHNLIPGPVTNQVTVYAQHEVLTTWTVVADSVTEAFKIPAEAANFRFIETTGGNFPTNASARCDWGDGTPVEDLAFVNPGDSEPILSHQYTKHGWYTITALIYNVVSSFEVTCDVLIIEQVQDFVIVNKYFPTDFSTESRPGFGNLKHQFPKDRNVTFYPEMSFGTVETYEVTFTVNGSEILTYSVADMFNPLENFFYHHFDVEAFLNLTITAVNLFERVDFFMFAEVLEQVKVVEIDDFSIITKKEEEKSFKISFLTLGGGACLVVDWGDTYPLQLETYGDEVNCQMNFSHAVYTPDIVLDLEQTFTHTYQEDGVYNVSVYGYNPVSSTSDVLMILVTSMDCRPPEVVIFEAVLDYLAAPQMYRSEDNAFSTVASVDCALTSKTKKRWQIYQVDSLYGYITLPILTMDIIETWNMPEIIIQGNYLNYGHYVLTYTLTIWDPDLQLPPKEWPFQRQTDAFFEIIPTPLIPSMFEAGVKRIIRGKIQEILFDPATNSIDPDYPDDKIFDVIWRCRKVGEAWPTDDTTPFPIWPPGGLGTGCFGYGPGLLDYNGMNLTVLGNDFIIADEIYEMEATISKDTRTALAIGEIHVVPYTPPIIELRCLVQELCRIESDGVYVNPSFNLALTADCVEYCEGSLQYKWIPKDTSESPLPVNDAYFPVGLDYMECSISKDFFTEYEDDGAFKVDVEGISPLGGAMYAFKINRRPVGGSCSVVEPPNRLALVEKYEISCTGWTDPENKGITVYGVFTQTPEGIITPLTDIKYQSAQPNSALLILPPGEFDVIVHIKDKWDAFTVYQVVPRLEVLMPTKEQMDAADISGEIAALSGAGNTPLLTMLLAAQSSVTADAPWLSLKEEDLVGLTQDEIDERLRILAQQNNDALDALMENTNYNTLGSISAAASTVAGILEAASINLQSYKTIDIEARDKVADVSEDILEGLMDLDIPSPDLLVPLVNYMGTIANGMNLGQKEAGEKETCDNAPPSDVVKSDDLPFDTRVPELGEVIPLNPTDIRRCNVRDITRERAKRIVPLIEDIVDKLCQSMLERMVTGEKYSVDTELDIHVKIGKVPRLTVLPIGNNGSKFVFPENFCPQGSCDEPVGYSLREWPFINHGYVDSVINLSPGTKILDLTLFDRHAVKLVVEDLEDDISITIPRTTGKMGNNTIPEFEEVDAITESEEQTVPCVYTTFSIDKNDSSVTLEIIPEESNPRLFIMISKPRMPTIDNYEHYKLVNDIPLEDGLHKWEFDSNSLNGMGSYYVGIGEFEEGTNNLVMADPMKVNDTEVSLQRMTTNYKIRIISAGCYFFDKKTSEWSSRGMSVASSTYSESECKTNHLTSFGTGMFVMPNTIDFNYVFANMGFQDNLTIYLTLIITISICVLLMIWARYKDRKDMEKLGASPLPDNKVEDKYFYEVLVFTGNVRGAQTDSLVQFIVSGDDDETDVRTFADSSRKILRKAGIDVFAMAVPRPLGQLQFLRIWHDNSGKGVNASWNLSYIVFRDVQTGDKYDFICNDWLAVEHSDGQIDRHIEVANRAQKTQFSHLYNTTTNRNIADGHLWFSVFLRPPRSRFTRCQRVASCFALLFLSMLVNAMWYETVAEQPGTGGLKLGPFSLSPEQIGVGVMANLIVFPPSFLIVFLFRKSRPRNLRKSRIEEAYERTQREKDSSNSDQNQEQNQEQYTEEMNQEEEGEEEILHKKVITKKEKNKKFTLPWWFSLIAWLLVIACIAVSVFFLLMYGIMFGNSKTIKWVTSLIISFFSSVLFVQPLKIFITAMLVSIIFKSVDLDEDDADEDEKEPNLEQDEAWLHKGEKCPKVYKQKRVDSELLRGLRIKRKKEMEMWSMIKEIFFYALFLWILLILSYGNRDPNAFFLQKSLREGFLHEGALDGTDYTKVTNADRLWKYLFIGLMPDLRADYMYNGLPPYGLRGYFNDWCNRMIGYAIIRQIRTKENTCSVPAAMNRLELNCSGFTSLIDEDTEHYCLGWVRPKNKTKNEPECRVPEFRYETSAELQSLPIWGERDWYGGGGYVFHLKESTGNILKKMRLLQENGWIDSKTRAILIEFSSYNSQVNLFGTSLIMAEFTPGGGITPAYRFEGIRLIQHHDNFGFFIICCEIGFLIFVGYYTVREIKLMFKQRRHYFDSYWAYAEISILAASYSAIIMYVLRYFATRAILDVFRETKGNGYVRSQYAASIDETYGYMVAFIVFVGTIKFAKLLRFNKRIGVLSATLHQCWDDLSGFLMAFFLCFASFVALFYMLLNMYLADFYNFVTAIETCFSMMLGKFQFEEMKQASMMVPIMFFIFVLFNSWVLINLLLTLVIKSFQKVKRDIMNQPNEYEMVAFVWGRFKAFLGYGEPPIDIGPLETTARLKSDEDDTAQNVKEFPNKVDKFLDYVNNAYFAGSLDVNNRDALKSSFYRNEMSRKASGIIGATSANPKLLGNRTWYGADEHGRGTLAKREEEKKAASNNRGGGQPGVKYEGPRISNKFQAELDDF